MKRFLKILLIILILSIVIENANAKTIRDLKNQLQEYEQQQQDNNSNIALTNSQINAAKYEVSQIYSQIDTITTDIKNTEEEIITLNKEIEEKDIATKNLMSSLQITNGNSFYLEYLFGSESITDFIYRYSLTEQITNYNSNLMKEMDNLISQNKIKIETLSAKEKELNVKQEQLSSRIASLNASNVKLYELGTSIEDEIKNTKQVIQMYVDAGCNDDDDINVCANKLLPPDTKFWRPFNTGYVTSEYGYRDAIYSGGRLVASSGFHEGIDLSNGLGTSNPVYSIANGKVAAVWYDQWGGNQVTIHHNINGKAYSSSYAHFSKILVKKGDIVTKDTVIAMMGATGSATGYHLHLAISTGLRFTEYSSYNTYVAKTINPRKLINFPSYGSWRDKISQYN